MDDGSGSSGRRQANGSLEESDVAKGNDSLDADLVLGNGVLLLVQQTTVVVGEVERAGEELTIGPDLTPELSIQLLAEGEVEISAETLISGLIPG